MSTDLVGLVHLHFRTDVECVIRHQLEQVPMRTCHGERMFRGQKYSFLLIVVVAAALAEKARCYAEQDVRVE